MKRILTNSMLCIAGFLISSGLYAQCTAGFTWTQSTANTIVFTNTSTPINNMTVFMWSFGDQQYNYQTNPTHYYNVPGTFYVCLTMWDSLSNCQASFCDTITVTGNVNCIMTANAMSQPASCAACSDGNAGVTTTNGTSPYTYVWSNGGTTQIQNNLLPGVYSVCVTDANGCTACDTVTVTSQQQSGCNASFTFTQGSNGQVNFTNTSTGVSGFTTYAWSFGDNTNSTVTSPQHTYTSTGNYIVCLTLTTFDSMQNSCTSTFCDTIAVVLSSVNDLARAEWKIFPNPAQDQINIQHTDATRGMEYRILDITGQVVSTGRLNSSQIDIHQLDAGVYILELKNNTNERSVQRFVKE